MSYEHVYMQPIGTLLENAGLALGDPSPSQDPPHYPHVVRYLLLGAIIWVLNERVWLSSGTSQASAIGSSRPQRTLIGTVAFKAFDFAR